MHLDSRFVFALLAILPTSIAACSNTQSEQEPTPNDATGDTSATDASAHDTAEPETSPPDAGPDDSAADANTNVDTSEDTEPTPDITPDAEVDAEADATTDVAPDTLVDAETDTEACDTVAVAADVLGWVDSISEGSVTVVEDAGVLTWTIHASAGGPALAASSPWLYIDLTTGDAVALTDIEAASETGWTLAFKRSVIRVNNADSGPGTWLLARVDETAFDDLTTPPGRDATWLSDDFVTDICEVLTEGRDTPVTAFGIWYDYDPGTHAVTPLPDTTWVLYDRTSHAVYKLGIDQWTSGVFTMRVSAL